MTTGLPPFEPPWAMQNPHLQSALRSIGVSRWLAHRRSAKLRENEQRWLMDGGDGVRLQGFFTPAAVQSKGLAVLLHGWEGSSASSYMLTTGTRLLNEGYDVFRLNFRDHGDSHALNPGIFHSCRLDEVIYALADLQRRTHARSWKISGFSLGGNFALRVALKGPAAGLDVNRCVAICPVLNPDNVLKLMENGPTFYESYYNRKWAESVKLKQSYFPDRYDYDAFFGLRSMRERTRLLATRHYGFDSLDDYFEGYAVDRDKLSPLTVDSTIVTSADDPVVPVSDIESLPDNPKLEVMVTRHGGHCGYLKNWKLESWAEDLIVNRFEGVGQGAMQNNRE
ncbi:MAG: alpha/beta fold hydrolase [Xanthomonadales bacterium]|nr:alpha/beta fold hydrolase [Gammaproteobacteria bacterium]NNE05709.1 alpha/beta fold hydrolase [Xanthomonadales bacterium]NNL94760.1 alpha/beta fold hydrolase [Xanthomonadales bacterium]